MPNNYIVIEAEEDDKIILECGNNTQGAEAVFNWLFNSVGNKSVSIKTGNRINRIKVRGKGKDKGEVSGIVLSHSTLKDSMVYWSQQEP